MCVEFNQQDGRACPSRKRRTTSARGSRMRTLRAKEAHEALPRARTEQRTKTWKGKYALRPGIEGTTNQALDDTGIRRARYRGLPKVRLQHTFSATAINIVRLNAHWSDHPLRRVRTSPAPAEQTDRGRSLVRQEHRCAQGQNPRDDQATLPGTPAVGAVGSLVDLAYPGREPGLGELPGCPCL
ncbi:transposase [Streptomyces sp. NPDC127051]|uniref:transposase n=1 Tax=Streptomyces sp. NPDC127051 TaxID=3347119 RepID=UPI00365A7457